MGLRKKCYLCSICLRLLLLPLTAAAGPLTATGGLLRGHRVYTCRVTADEVTGAHWVAAARPETAAGTKGGRDTLLGPL